MKYHEAIVPNRRRGWMPDSVWLHPGPDVDLLREWPQVSPDRPQVVIEDADVPERLDLRFLIGCRVIVHGVDADRVQRVARAALTAGAQSVLADAPGYLQRLTLETLHG